MCPGLMAAKGHRHDSHHEQLFARQPGRVSKIMEVGKKIRESPRKYVWHKDGLFLREGVEAGRRRSWWCVLRSGGASLVSLTGVLFP